MCKDVQGGLMLMSWCSCVAERLWVPERYTMIFSGDIVNSGLAYVLLFLIHQDLTP